MGNVSISAGGGICVEYGPTKFLLDPRGRGDGDIVFVSHAHIDHMHRPSRGESIMASRETRELALERGYDLGATLEELEGVELLDSGHILGSRAIRIADEFFYTGDASGRERGFLGKCRTKRARVLITETTYGSPEYVFPPTARLVKEVNTLIGECFDKGRPVVLMGYPLGKAQLISYYFSSWEPLYFHEAVARMNEVYRRNGVKLKRGNVFNPEGQEPEGGLLRGPWVMVAPLMSGRSRLMSRLRRDYGAVLVAFSGWAVKSGYSSSLSVDHAFPLSDHCDYRELLGLVQAVSPETVYTTHGFAGEFARDLRRMGFSARSLNSYQSSLLDYFRAD